MLTNSDPSLTGMALIRLRSSGTRFAPNASVPVAATPR